jgi:hypothetical protein
MARKQADWMCTLDERIIERLTEDSLASPEHLERVINFNASRRRIEERCGVLSDAGLIAPIVKESSMYEVTSEGQRYLAGDLDVNHLPTPRVRQ